MKKVWMNRATALLERSLRPFPQELNEIDWKETLSPKNDKLAKHLAAFSNLPGGGFMVFGIEDKTGKLNGVSQEEATSIIDRLASIGRDTLNPVVKLDHAIEDFGGVPLLFVHVAESHTKPVYLSSGSIEDTYVRSGGSTRKASRHEIGGLMLNSRTPQFEELHCSQLMTGGEVMNALDYRTIFGLLKKPVPQQPDEILKWMVDEKMVEQVEEDQYYITNFGALSAAHELSDFDRLSRKSIRLIRYRGVNKLETEKEYPGSKGYAIGFRGLISFIKALLPASEIIKNALREETSVYPDIALREIIANALIHQDFSLRGSGPMIEIFDDRLEVSNPGRLLPSKTIDRLIRTTPESRNEILAAAFRRYNICEERGSGFEKAVAAIEFYGLPPLRFLETDNSFRVVMYSPRKFADMTSEERVEAAYQHSIIRYFSSGAMTNASLRERFRMNEKQRPQVSLVIREALNQGRIKLKDPKSTSLKFAEYIPYWG
jgi:ATP-dependent DNA helicase RecG